MHSVARKPILATLFLAGVAVAAISGSGPGPAASTATPQFNPNNFVRNVDNPFFPLVPGATYFYEGQSDGVPTSTITEVTNQTKRILGVRTTVVRDRNFEDGVLIEETFDWYAQDRQGNVWYFGEDSRDLDENGNVISTEGSWQAGVNGAQAGIIMLADPKKGDRYSQEVAPGVAEDMAQVIALDGSVCVPYGCFDGMLVTKEWTPLERGVVEHKYYAEGIGFVFGIMVKGGDETTELVNITGPGAP